MLNTEDFRLVMGMNLIMAIDHAGNSTGIDGSSRSLSNPQDHALLMAMRRQADLVITDAATARVEKYRASKVVPIDVWSKTGNSAGLQLDKYPDTEAITFRQINTIADEIDRLSGKRVLLETGKTLSAMLAPYIQQAIFTVIGSAGDAAAAFKLASHLGLNELSESRCISDQVNSYLVLNRRGRLN